MEWLVAGIILGALIFVTIPFWGPYVMQPGPNRNDEYDDQRWL